MGHLEAPSGASGGSEWGTCRLRVGHLQAQNDINNNNANDNNSAGPPYMLRSIFKHFQALGHLEARRIFFISYRGGAEWGRG